MVSDLGGVMFSLSRFAFLLQKWRKVFLFFSIKNVYWFRNSDENASRGEYYLLLRYMNVIKGDLPVSLLVTSSSHTGVITIAFHCQLIIFVGSK